MKKRLPLLLAVFILFPACAADASADGKMTAIVGGDIYTITSGVIKNGTVLIKEGKIFRVGDNVEVPKAAAIIDAKGKIVMPGLIAASSRGIGVLRSIGARGKIADSLDPFGKSVSLALAGGVTTVFAAAGGPKGDNPIGGASAVIKLTEGDLDGMLLKEPASVSVGLSSLSARFNLKQALKKAMAYVRKSREYEEAKKKGTGTKITPPKKDPRLSSALKLVTGELPARISASRTDDILAALELVDELNIRIILDQPTEGWVVADKIAERNAPVIITIRRKLRPNRDISAPSGSTIENAALLKKAGVRFAIVPPSTRISTGGIAGRDLMTLPLEAAFAVRGGLDEETALRAITINAARILGVDDRVGSIQEGKDADIIILDGHPFHYKTFVTMTMVNGKVLYEKDKSPYFSHIRR